MIEDHQHADELANKLSDIEGVDVVNQKAQTNMVYVNVNDTMRKRIAELASDRDIILPSGNNMRLVTHLNINSDDIKSIIELFKQAA